MDGLFNEKRRALPLKTHFKTIELMSFEETDSLENKNVA